MHQSPQKLRPREVDGTPERSPKHLESSPAGTSKATRASQCDDTQALVNAEDAPKDAADPFDDIIRNFLWPLGITENLNTRSFLQFPPRASGGRTRSEGTIPHPITSTSRPERSASGSAVISLDPRLLKIGDIGENATWWSGQAGEPDNLPTQETNAVPETEPSESKVINRRSPNVHWEVLRRWYHEVLSAGATFDLSKFELLQENLSDSPQSLTSDRQDLWKDIDRNRMHMHRVLITLTENALKRPGRILRHPKDLRFLLIILANPLLYPWKAVKYENMSALARSKSNAPQRTESFRKASTLSAAGAPGDPDRSPRRREPTPHWGILKRVFGLIANSPSECQACLVSWFSRYSESSFRDLVELANRFISHRLERLRGKTHKGNIDEQTIGLIPELSSGVNASARLHAALGIDRDSPDVGYTLDGTPAYREDWQIRSAAQFMKLLFAANAVHHSAKPSADNFGAVNGSDHHLGTAGRPLRVCGQLLSVSDFYSTALDQEDVVADFKLWEKRTGAFSFCQYPFLLSMVQKIRLLEFDNHRQMAEHARQTHFNNLSNSVTQDEVFKVVVRRDCLANDGLQKIGKVLGGSTDYKKGLRVQFVDEEGVDVGGLRKEFFMLAMEEIFKPDGDLFVFDDESNFCYFNSHTFERPEAYYRVGALLGLAVYNSTILEIPFPPFFFRKLLAAAPTSFTNYRQATSCVPPRKPFSARLSDLAELHPSLAHGLKQLLEFEGDVESTYCRTFALESAPYGSKSQTIPLIPNGENISLDNVRRTLYVSRRCQYALDEAIERQFEPFARGFFACAGSNSLHLLHPTELRAAICGSQEAFSLGALRQGTTVSWPKRQDKQTNPDDSGVRPAVLDLFWHALEREHQKGDFDRLRALLRFWTGSSCPPAGGWLATSMRLEVVSGDDRERFPSAATCFNLLRLPEYDSLELLETKLWGAVDGAVGFGLR
ncbi:hypothetical protein K402DRAFT_320981 [Aulographum hederae CBS 113979]|uniref:HECT-type E3 ubiquitin transferase n=1 Tax=Aulographum hederae CBS 113979 TaxID=1176131 RepID=A0A6G1HHS6_9PEZI|nr:hypothetical protein K402DRAFT_320981 [Aulographum hederae CBS 113979]